MLLDATGPLRLVVAHQHAVAAVRLVAEHVFLVHAVGGHQPRHHVVERRREIVLDVACLLLLACADRLARLVAAQRS